MNDIQKSAPVSLAPDSTTLLNNLQTGVFLAKPIHSGVGIDDFLITYANPQAGNICRKPLDTMLGQRLTHLAPFLRSDGLFSQYIQVFRTGEKLHLPHLNYVAGEVEWQFSVHVSKAGEWLMIDFSENPKKQPVARRSGHNSNEHTFSKGFYQLQLLKEVIDSFPSGVLFFEPVFDGAGSLQDFRCSLANRTHADRLGRTTEQMRGLSLASLFGETESSFFLQTLKKVYQTGEEAREVREFSTSGFSGWFDLLIQPKPGGVLAVISDVTALKTAELVQKRQAQLKRRILDLAPVGILLLEAVRAEDGTIVDFVYRLSNRTHAELFGFKVENVQGRRLSQLFNDHQSLPMYRAFVEVTETGQSQQKSFRLNKYKADGWFEGHLEPYGDGLLFSFTDITSRHKALEVLEKANRQLVEFTSIASHDLQEPLRKIQSFGELIRVQYGESLAPEVTTLLGRMQASAKRMSGLVRDLLAYSRMDRQANPEPVPLNEIVEELKEDLKDRLTELGGSIDVLTELPTVSGDNLQLEQLFQNLLVNAIKYHRHGVAPHIRVEARRIPDLPVGETPADPESGKFWWAISIHDNGIGFEPKYKDQIFGMFKRLHGRSGPYEGTGIGLAIVKRVLEAHDGRIEVESQPGVGSTFTVFLPDRPREYRA